MKFVICGSVLAEGQSMKELADALLAMGHDVTVWMDVPYPRTHIPHEKSADRKFYYSRIDGCDAVVICNGKDHIGFETACEVGYAIARKKMLYFTHESSIDGVKALLSDGSAHIFDIWRIEHLEPVACSVGNTPKEDRHT
jgi:nucleoside 2-deoxyribosyltransferase